MPRRRPSALRIDGPGRCPRCGDRLGYSERYDAALCVACDRWSDPACWDVTCAFCRDRLPRPSLAREHTPTDPALRRAAARGARRTRTP